MGMDAHFDSSFFSHTINTSTLVASAPLMTPPPADSAPTTIKMEDLQVPFDAPSPAYSSFPCGSDASAPPSATTEAKPVKKRKSWGQVLPEPKTALPPRKRAKTEDEKGQRRIERVKRNPLAAHNSRERKRQEYEILQAEKDQMEADLKAFQQKMAQMKAELKYYRQKYPGEVPETIFDLASPTTDSFSTVCPAQTSAEFPSPVSMDSQDSPRDSSYQPETPASTFAHPELDSTQYPAVSVDFGNSFNLAGGDLGLSFPVQPHPSLDEKPVVMDNLFDFDQFPEGSTTAPPAEPITGLADASSLDFFGSAFYGHNSSSIPCSFPDGFDAKYSDLQSASGATFVSDEALAAEL